MTPHPTDIEPDIPATLATLLQDFGGCWQIGQQAGSAAWEAIRRPTPSQTVVHVALTLPELRGKLEADEL